MSLYNKCSFYNKLFAILKIFLKILPVLSFLVNSFIYYFYYLLILLYLFFYLEFL